MPALEPVTETADRFDGEKTAGRGARGRFTRGNPGGPGRPPRLVERHYLQALSEACPVEVWREIVAAAVESAKAGDAQARGWLSKHLLGDSRLYDMLSDDEKLEEIRRGDQDG